ncbi:unnamed protein product, partial [Thlaspi arvense]
MCSLGCNRYIISGNFPRHSKTRFDSMIICDLHEKMNSYRFSFLHNKTVIATVMTLTRVTTSVTWVEDHKLLDDGLQFLKQANSWKYKLKKFIEKVVEDADQSQANEASLILIFEVELRNCVSLLECSPLVRHNETNNSRVYTIILDGVYRANKLLNALSPPIITVESISLLNLLASGLICFGHVAVMDEGRQKDLQLLEEIIDKGLKHKLVHTIASRYSNLPPFQIHIFQISVTINMDGIGWKYKVRN